MTDADGSAMIASTVLHVGGMYRGSEKNIAERVLSRRPGVISVEANPVAQSPKPCVRASTGDGPSLRLCGACGSGGRPSRREEPNGTHHLRS
jgi:hypothetical protein